MQHQLLYLSLQHPPSTHTHTHSQVAVKKTVSRGGKRKAGVDSDSEAGSPPKKKAKPKNVRHSYRDSLIQRCMSITVGPQYNEPRYNELSVKP